MDSPQYEHYLEAFRRHAGGAEFKSRAEARWVCLMLATEAMDDPFGPLASKHEHFWRGFLDANALPEREHGKLAGLVLERVGAHYAAVEVVPAWANFGTDSKEMRDARKAVETLEESIRRDPERITAYLKLLEVFEQTERVADANRLLDQMTALFPNDKAVLFRAGKECLDRKAYVKGLEYLERARALDPLDQTVLNGLAFGYTMAASQHYVKGAIGKGRRTFDALGRCAETERFDLSRGWDFVQGRQAVLESLCGDRDLAKRLMDKAVQSSKSIPALVFSCHAFFRVHVRSGESPLWPTVLASIPKNPKERAELYLALVHGRGLRDQIDWSQEQTFISQCLSAAMDADADFGELIDLLMLIAEDPVFYDLALEMVEAGKRKNAANPRLRILDLLLNRLQPPDAAKLEEMVQIREQARRDGDTQLARIAGGIIDNLRAYFSPNRLGGGNSAGNEDDVGFGDFDSLDEFGPSGSAPSFLPPEFEEIQRATLEMSDSEFAKFRKKSAKKIPLAVFDMLITSARKNKRDLPEPIRPVPAGPRPSGSRGQLALF